MKSKEIDDLILQGKSLIIYFLPRQLTFEIGGRRITRKQFDSAKNRFGDSLKFKADYSGFTKHYYSLNND